MALEIPVIQPVFDALSTSEGWIGLLLGFGGRTTVRGIRQMITTLRDKKSSSDE